MTERLSPKGQQLLLLLGENKILKFRQSPQGYFKIVSEKPELWTQFSRKTLFTSIHTLYTKGFAEISEGLDNITTIRPTDTGRRTADEFARMNFIPVKPGEWDHKWRLILFDVPEQKKKFREAFRYHLRRLGFTEFQRSAFLFPFPCAEAIDALADRFNLKDHIVMVTAESLSNEFQFKKKFGLL